MSSETKKLQLGGDNPFIDSSQPFISTAPRYKESSYDKASKHDIGLGYDTDQATHRAVMQDNWEAIRIKTANTIQNILPSAIEQLALLPSLAMHSQRSREYTESVNKIFSGAKNSFGEVYTKGDDAAWWINTMGSLVESSASFVVTGGAIGAGVRGLTYLAQARNIAKGLQALNAGVSLKKMKDGISIGENLATTYFTSAVEGQMNGLESSNKIKQMYANNIDFRNKVDAKAKQQGMSSHSYLELMQNSAFSTAANISTMVGMPLNFTGVSSIFAKTKAMQSYRKANPSLYGATDDAIKAIDNAAPEKRNWTRFAKTVGSEALQEGIEEGGQSIAGRIAEDRADKGKGAIALGNYVEAFKSLEDLDKTVFDNELFTSMMLGALGGSMQTGLIQGFSNQNKINKRDLESYEVLKDDFLNNIETVENKKKELDSIISGITSAEEYEAKRPEIEKIKQDIYNVSVREALKKDSLDLIMGDIQSIYNLSPTDTAKAAASKRQKEFETESLPAILEELEITQEQLNAFETAPETLDAELVKLLENNPNIQKYQELKKETKEASSVPIVEEMGLDENYKAEAQQKLKELKLLRVRYNDYATNYEEYSEAQRLNTIDVFLKKEKLTEIQDKIKAKEENLNTDIFTEEFEEALEEDLDYQKLMEDELTKEAEEYKIKKKKTDDKEIKELKKEVEKLEREIKLQDNKEYRTRLRTEKFGKLGSFINKLKEHKASGLKLEIDNFNHTLNQEFRNEILTRNEVNRTIDESEEAFETLEEDVLSLLANKQVQQAYDKIREILKYLPRTDANEEAFSEMLTVFEPAFKKAFLIDLFEKEVDADGNLNVLVDDIDNELIPFDTIIEELLQLDISQIKELRYDTIANYSLTVITDAYTNHIDEINVIYDEWKPEPKRKLRSKQQIATEYVESQLDSINNSLITLSEEDEIYDIAELNRQADKLNAIKVILENIEDWKFKDYSTKIKELTTKVALTRSKLQNKIDAARGDEVAKYEAFKSEMIGAEYETILTSMNSTSGLDGDIKTVIRLVKSILANRYLNKTLINPIDMFRLTSNFEITDALIATFSGDEYVHTMLKNAQKVLNSIAGREANVFFNTPLFDDKKFNDALLKVVKDKYPSPEQYIVIKQAVALLINNQHTFTQGLAGTGKTTIVAKYVKAVLEEMSGEIIVEATAMGELIHDKITDELGTNKKFDININIEETFNALTKAHPNKKIVFIIDEAPKLNHEETYELEAAMKANPNIVVYFTGDTRQLQSKGTHFTASFFALSNYIYSTIPLTQSKRSGNASVLKLQTQYTRDSRIDENETFSYEVENGEIQEGVVVVKTKAELLSQKVKNKASNSVIITDKPDMYKDNEEGIRVMTPFQAQGSDFDNVFIDITDSGVGNSEEVTAQKYVAAARAIKTIIIIENFKSKSQAFTEKIEDSERFTETEKWFKSTVGFKEKKKVEPTLERDNRKDKFKNTKQLTDYFETNPEEEELLNDYLDYISNLVPSSDEAVEIAENVKNLTENKITLYLASRWFAQKDKKDDTKNETFAFVKDIDEYFDKNPIAKIEYDKYEEAFKSLAVGSAEYIEMLEGVDATDAIALILHLANKWIKQYIRPPKKDNGKKIRNPGGGIPNVGYSVNNKNLTILLETNNQDLSNVIVYEVYGRRNSDNVATVYVMADIKNNGRFVEIATRYEHKLRSVKETDTEFDGKRIFNNTTIKVTGLTEKEVKFHSIATKKIDTIKTNVIEEIIGDESQGLTTKINNISKFQQLLNSVAALANGIKTAADVGVMLHIATKRITKNVFQPNEILPSGSVFFRFTIGKKVLNVPVDGKKITKDNNADFKAISEFMDKVKAIETKLGDNFKFMSGEETDIFAGNVRITKNEMFRDIITLANDEVINKNEKNGGKIKAVKEAFLKLNQDDIGFLSEMLSKLHSTDTINAFAFSDSIEQNFNEVVEVSKNQIIQKGVTFAGDGKLDENGYTLVVKTDYNKTIVKRKIVQQVYLRDGTMHLRQIKFDYEVLPSGKQVDGPPSVSIFNVGIVNGWNLNGENNDNITKITDMFNNFTRNYSTYGNTTQNVLYNSQTDKSMFDSSRTYAITSAYESDVMQYVKTGKIINPTTGEIILAAKLTKKRDRLQKSFDNIVASNKLGEGGILLRVDDDTKSFGVTISNLSKTHRSITDPTKYYDTREVLESFLLANLYLPLQKSEINEFNDNTDKNNDAFLSKITVRSEGFKSANLELIEINNKNVIITPPVMTTPSVIVGTKLTLDMTLMMNLADDKFLDSISAMTDSKERENKKNELIAIKELFDNPDISKQFKMANITNLGKIVTAKKNINEALTQLTNNLKC